MISNPLKHAGRLSVGAKLAAVLVVAVFGSTLLLAGVQSWLSQRSVEEHFRLHASSHLQRALRLMGALGGREGDPARTLRAVQRHPTMRTQVGRGFKLFGLDPEGRVVVEPLDPLAILPPEKLLRRMASTAWGVTRFFPPGPRGAGGL